MRCTRRVILLSHKSGMRKINSGWRTNRFGKIYSRKKKRTDLFSHFIFNVYHVAFTFFLIVCWLLVLSKISHCFILQEGYFLRPIDCPSLHWLFWLIPLPLPHFPLAFKTDDWLQHVFITWLFYTRNVSGGCFRWMS
jgi:hypothetical protein